MAAAISEFRPNWASAPGDTITDILDEQGLSVGEFARRIGHTLERTNDLLQGRATITIRTARQLEKVLGASVEFWIARDFQYREDMARIHATDEVWLGELPIGDMIRFGWLKPPPRPSEETEACLRFFDVPSVAAWRQNYSGIEQLVAFRTSPSFDSRAAAVAAWIRKGEIDCASTECAPWNAAQFRDSLPDIRRLTLEKDPSRFMPALRQICSASGVAAVVVRAPNGCRASGATRFVSRDKALLLLSFRYLSDDQFWFTFFHEAGHLVLHGQESMFLEGLDAQSTAQEVEANEFAERILVPVEFKDAMLRLPADMRAIMRFAKRIGVSPGIVVGQLQHHGKVPRHHFNGLKRRFQWDEGEKA